MTLDGSGRATTERKAEQPGRSMQAGRRLLFDVEAIDYEFWHSASSTIPSCFATSWPQHRTRRRRGRRSALQRLPQARRRASSAARHQLGQRPTQHRLQLLLHLPNHKKPHQQPVHRARQHCPDQQLLAHLCQGPVPQQHRPPSSSLPSDLAPRHLPPSLAGDRQRFTNCTCRPHATTRSSPSLDPTVLLSTPSPPAK